MSSCPGRRVLMPTLLGLGRHAAHHGSSAVRQAMQPVMGDSLSVGSRRWFLRTGLAGIVGLSLADTLRLQATASGAATGQRDPKGVILFWLSGGPSHIDMWDPKPDAP